MAQYFQIHPANPQLRLIHRAVDIIRDGGVIVYPTDSSYALACHLDDKRALDRIRRIRQLDNKHNFTLVCEDLSQVSNFAKIGNEAYRMIKSLTPGPFTFVLKATRDVPRRLLHPKRKTVGIRVPGHPVAQLLLKELAEPMLSTTMILPGESEPLEEPYLIRERMEHEVDLVIDADPIPNEPTTVVLLTEQTPEILRQGKGIVADL